MCIIQNIPDYDSEHSEVLLYHIRVLEDLGEFTEGLSLLDINAKSRAITDRVAIMEFRGEENGSTTYTGVSLRILARLLSKLGQHDDAEHTWQALIEQNPDAYDYYRGWFSNRGINLGMFEDRLPNDLPFTAFNLDNVTDDDRPKTLEALQDFVKQLPRAAAPHRLALAISTGEAHVFLNWIAFFI